MTRKLYWQDSRLLNFRAKIVELIQRDSGGGLSGAIVLDQTAFYPESGGQPADLGRIGEVGIDSVEIGDDGRILHWTKSVLAGGVLSIGEELDCRVDPSRRREMTQQHTAQHILSQAFFQLFGAETRGFRINDRVTEIDLAFDAPVEEAKGLIREAENLANSIVFDNRSIRTHLVTPEEAAKMPLRKESFVSDCVRVVEIEDFDWSPCGGTHAGMTGEVGLIAIRGWERAKKMTRVQFVAGVRALTDYRAANESAEGAARLLSVGREEVPVTVERVQEESRRQGKRIRELAQIAAEIEASTMIESAIPFGANRLVLGLFEDRGLEELKLLAHRLVAHPGMVAMLGAREAGAARLVFARADRVDLDMSRLMKKACDALGGRGGGRPEFAQGGGDSPIDLETLLREISANTNADPS